MYEDTRIMVCKRKWVVCQCKSKAKHENTRPKHMKDQEEVNKHNHTVGKPLLDYIQEIERRTREWKK
jgi:hypothetical protein